MSGGLSRSAWMVLLLILVAHLANALAGGPPALVQDAAHYDDIARNLAAGNGFAFSPEMQYPWERDELGTAHPTARRPPLFPVLLSGLYRAGFGPRAMILANVGFFLLAALALHGLGRELGLGERARLLLLVLFLVFPRFYEFTPRLLTEPLYLALLLSGAWALARCVNTRSGRAALLGGVLLGLATLARPTTLLFPLVLFPFLAFRSEGTVRAFLLLAFAFALTLSPWVARNAATFGRFEPSFTSRGYNLFMGSYPPTRGASNLPEDRQPPELVAAMRGKDEFAINRLYTRAAIENVREHPGEFVKLVGAKAVLCWFQTKPEENMFRPTPRSFLVGAPFLLLGLAGFGILLRRGNRLAWIPLVFVGYFVAVHLASVATVRYNLPSMPFLLLGSAVALDAILARRGDRGARRIG